MHAPKNCPDPKRPPEGKVRQLDPIEVKVAAAIQFNGGNALEVLFFMGVASFSNLELHRTDHPVVNGKVCQHDDWVIKTHDGKLILARAV